VLARLDKTPGVRESRVDWTGRHFLLKLDPGADVGAVTRAAAAVLGAEARRVDADVEMAHVERYRRGEPWMRAGETRRLSAEEAGALAKRFAAGASRKAALSGEEARRLEEVLREEIGAAFERVHASEEPLERLGEEFPLVLERVTGRLMGFLTADKARRVTDALAFMAGR
jgi:hypothetical protein